jgi:hypothetical protein
MKHLIFSTLLLACLLTGTVTAFSQTDIMFTYDNAGNRVRRELVELKTTTATTHDSIPNDSLARVQKSTVNIGNTTVSVFPNPTPGVAQIEVTGDMPQTPGTMQVFDFAGKSIISKPFNESNSSIDLSNFSDGKYILKIVCNNKSKEWVLVKQ